MVSLKVNGAEEQLQVATVAELLELKGMSLDQKGIAVALNSAVVPRRTWRETRLKNGDEIEIITARQGG
ncbi:sulfur carrier protein ThiS [Xanthobacter sp. TB0136]|uniref:sulfur carrier protein ThiS n=1 Tax=Xanthobacter sp. TB0136 TaxID=3459177 RepID=UPI004039ACAF